MKDYKEIIPVRFQNVSYKNDVIDQIKEIATKQIRQGNGLYIYGSRGIGKTHTACAIAKNVILNGLDIRFFNTGDLLEKLREEYSKTQTEIEENQKSLFRDVMDFQGVLFLDDIGAEKITEWAKERLYLIINKKYEDMMPIIFTSNCNMSLLSTKVGDRITSRIMGMVEIIEKTGNDMRVTKNNEAN